MCYLMSDFPSALKFLLNEALTRAFGMMALLRSWEVSHCPLRGSSINPELTSTFMKWQELSPNEFVNIYFLVRFLLFLLLHNMLCFEIGFI